MSSLNYLSRTHEFVAESKIVPGPHLESSIHEFVAESKIVPGPHLESDEVCVVSAGVGFSEVRSSSTVFDEYFSITPSKNPS